MAIPDYQSLLLPVLRIASKGEIAVRDAVQVIGDDLHLTPEERSELLPSGKQTTFSNRVHWAKTYLMKAGLVQAARRGVFIITERGQQVLAEDPERIDLGFLMQFPEFRSFRERSGSSDSAASKDSQTDEAMTPDEMMRSAHRRLDEELGAELLERILSAPPDFFERLIVQLLIAMGYGGSASDAGRALGRSGDGGVDGVIDEDTLGLDRIYVQAKRYAPANAVGPGAIRDFFGSLDRFKATKGLFVTTSEFSTAARETAELLSKRIVLLDGRQLTKLMIRHDVGCRLEEELKIKRIDEDFFE